MKARNDLLIRYALNLNCLTHCLVLSCISDNNITVLKKSTTRTSSFSRITYIRKPVLLCINYRRKAYQNISVVNILVLPSDII